MKRKLVPELLDHLPPDDPSAQWARRDLRHINFFMGNARILGAKLDRLPTPPRKIVEIGAGDGRLLLRILQRKAELWPGGEIVFVDLVDVILDETREALEQLGWTTHVQIGNVLESLPEADLILANLFLHHFEGEELTRLLRRISESTPTFLCVEPRRTAFGLAGAKALGLIGCNHITRHDAFVSVRAGFIDNELSVAWPLDTDWTLSEDRAFPFSHVFLAEQNRTEEEQP